MAIIGFNVGSVISLGDMSLAVDYLTNKEAFEPDLHEIKSKNNKDSSLEIKNKYIEQDSKELELEVDYTDDEDTELKYTDEDDMFDLSDIDDYEDMEGGDNDGYLENVKSSEDDASKNDTSAHCSSENDTSTYNASEDGVSEDDASENDEIDDLLAGIDLSDFEDYNEDTVYEDVDVKKDVRIEQINLKEETLKKELEQLEKIKEKKKYDELKLLEKKVLQARKALEQEDKKEINKTESNATIKQKNNVKLNVVDYSEMNIDALYKEVRNFMGKRGISKTIMDRKILDEEFGVNNIKKLILKSYLISIGKGVTIGR